MASQHVTRGGRKHRATRVDDAWTRGRTPVRAPSQRKKTKRDRGAHLKQARSCFFVSVPPPGPPPWRPPRSCSSAVRPPATPVAGTDRTRAREWPRPGTSRRAEGAILDRRDFGRVHESSKIANDFIKTTFFSPTREALATGHETTRRRYQPRRYQPKNDDTMTRISDTESLL